MSRLSSSRLAFLLALVSHLAAIINAETLHYTFVLAKTNLSRLCTNHTIVTVNGTLPGPTMYVHDGDSVIVKVINNADYNATIHWHGVRQLLTGWSDGPAYITQCPILPGGNFTHRFNITGQEGILFWHAHFSWLRATVYGAFVIYPKNGSSYPFSQPSAEFPILLGEWWNSNPIAVINEASLTGGAPNLSVAYTINGQPGDLYDCSSPETFRVPVNRGETYLLRIVNAALQNTFFFKISNHRLTVVAVDASYTKPYETDVVVISPGQTTDVLVTANQTVGRYYMAARPYSNLAVGVFDNSTTTAILEYAGYECNSTTPTLPTLPLYNDTDTVTKFKTALRSLASIEHPIDVPQCPDEMLLSTVGLGLLPCGPGNTSSCEGPQGMRFSASMNNVSFVQPKIALLQAAYYNIPDVFTTDFPSHPPVVFDYTGNVSQSLSTPERATTVKVLEYNSTVQLVFQTTSIVTGENHPMHLHGYSFYVVGQGFGDYNNLTDPANFNLVDPPKRNTVISPVSGWVAIRFRADNPGMWLLHCHLDDHFTWGLNMVFLVKNGGSPSETLGPPPEDLPKC